MNDVAAIIASGDCWKKIGVQGDATCPELQRVVHCRNCPVYSAAGHRVLDRPLPEGYRRDWARHYAPTAEKKAAETASTFLFRVGNEWLGLAPALFTEVIDVRPIHSLPHRRITVLRGLVNVRGELQICLSLGALLGIEEAPAATPNPQRRMLVVNGAGGRFVFAAEQVHGHHRYDPHELKPAPATVAQAFSRHSRGVLVWNQKSVGVLDEASVLAACERSLS